MNKERLAKLLQMLEENTSDTFLLYGIAMEHLGAQNKADALVWFLKVLALEPGHLAALYQTALLYQELGQTETACQQLEKGLALLQGTTNHKTRNEFRSLLDELQF
jgi:Tfp pilus assembly protein PilF